ncbi:uncharacterized protein LACBIDRAFT_298837 [Laccaria bicolor S238N-H82]|uniref:Predicted protein n=1 Tax=Laccaria bicolor (strain S238N-H82 / ATCC MYA-4686) TaxID=486041 RepID=B0DGD8_LACBS|nr:uncharacterized protein LACBIDRAFT_300281 [Laccaria bicolor S238N-H82]XP_001890761.1 uncharacterized protein LACBIDRAFT_298837 [Laccaria bicolor S238N-H82]EDQ98585.1 predicted protein [Laccaria bicolor S238N-H82]EDR06132.1 predicted protein [Laccaria bicolor S238N-H82]|eukprot:XP_001882993.1 predicted protein [Laccaria bicolor S238N-H82]
MASSLYSRDRHGTFRMHRGNPWIFRFMDDWIHGYLDPWILDELLPGQGDLYLRILEECQSCKRHVLRAS